LGKGEMPRLEACRKVYFLSLFKESGGGTALVRGHGRKGGSEAKKKGKKKVRDLKKG